MDQIVNDVILKTNTALKQEHDDIGLPDKSGHLFYFEERRVALATKAR